MPGPPGCSPDPTCWRVADLRLAWGQRLDSWRPRVEVPHTALWGTCTREELNPDANQTALSEGWWGPAPAALCPGRGRPGHRSPLAISKELCRLPSTLILCARCAEREVLSEPPTQSIPAKGRVLCRSPPESFLTATRRQSPHLALPLPAPQGLPTFSSPFPVLAHAAFINFLSRQFPSIWRQIRSGIQKESHLTSHNVLLLITLKIFKCNHTGFDR